MGMSDDLSQWDTESLSGANQDEKIFVSVRLRPLNEREKASNDASDWECINNSTIIYKNSLPERSLYPTAYAFGTISLTNPSLLHIFFTNCPNILTILTFNDSYEGLDRVFGPECSTKRVYEEGAKEIALSVLNGFNCKF